MQCGNIYLFVLLQFLLQFLFEYDKPWFDCVQYFEPLTASTRVLSLDKKCFSRDKALKHLCSDSKKTLSAFNSNGF